MGVAGRDVNRLHELEVLSKKWGWTDERMEVSAKIFERQASDATRLAELLDYYRSNARTARSASPVVLTAAATSIRVVSAYAASSTTELHELTQVVTVEGQRRHEIGERTEADQGCEPQRQRHGSR